MSSDMEPVRVRLGGRDFVFACPPEERTHMLAAASWLDQKMKAMQAETRMIGVERIALMAALNLADELLRQRESDHQLHEGIRRIQSRITEATNGDAGVAKVEYK